LRGLIDEKTCAILEEAGLEVAGKVLAEIKEKLDYGIEIKNPSAYAYRAVTNKMERMGTTRPSDLRQTSAASSTGPPEAKVPRVELDPEYNEQQQAGRDMLDAQTLKALDSMNVEDRYSILDDLMGKQDVRNPSAFVYRAVTNLQHRRNPPVAR
jgi:hypothetical protein